MIQLDINAKLYDLATAHPEIVDLMDEVGFHEIKMPGMLQTAGRMATIPMGAKMKRIDWDEIVRVFEGAGFEFIGVQGDQKGVAESADEGSQSEGSKS